MLNEHVLVLESEAGFKVLFECATVGILVMSSDGKIQLANPCIEKLFGYAYAELMGQPVEMLIPAAFRHTHIQHREQYFQQPKTRPMGLGLDLYARKKNGDEFPVEISLGHYALSNRNFAVAFVSDITQKTQARKIIEKREAMFRNMADHAPMMIWTSGTDKLFTYFNHTWLDFTGRSLLQEQGMGWTEGLFAEDIDMCLNKYRTAFDSRQPFTMEYRLRRHDGQYRWFHNAGKPVYSEDGVFTGYIGTCTDIHNRQMMMEELEIQVNKRTKELSDALQREKELNELKSRFVSMASHEFRTPLTAIVTSTSLIEAYNGASQEENRNRHILRIKSSVKNLIDIINDFLSLDKLEQGSIDTVSETFNLEAFLMDIKDEMDGLLKVGQRITCICEGKKDIVLDKKILKNILLNLLSNAVKYSGENTVIGIKGMVIHDAVTIEVRDEGIGIPEDEQTNLFNKFYRASNTENIQGTGLGLHIVKKYVDLLNGTMIVRSQLHKGTIVTIKFPQK